MLCLISLAHLLSLLLALHVQAWVFSPHTPCKRIEACSGTLWHSVLHLLLLRCRDSRQSSCSLCMTHTHYSVCTEPQLIRCMMVLDSVYAHLHSSVSGLSSQYSSRGSFFCSFCLQSSS